LAVDSCGVGEKRGAGLKGWQEKKVGLADGALEDVTCGAGVGVVFAVLNRIVGTIGSTLHLFDSTNHDIDQTPTIPTLSAHNFIPIHSIL
jgi:hypothetical protein